MPNPENIIPHKFKKGQSGNPKGRPIGSLSRSTIAKKWLDVEQSFKNPITQEFESLSQEDIITLAQIKKARQGDVNSYKALLDSAYGLPSHQSECMSKSSDIIIHIEKDQTTQ